VGLPGLAGTKDEGDAGKPADGCLCTAGAVTVDEGGTWEVVGVCVGVEWFEDWEAVVLIVDGVWCVFIWSASGPVYFSPSSPCAKDNAEQNPSFELIMRVNPSLDLNLVNIFAIYLIRKYIPSDICEGCVVQIANNTQGFLLLCIINMNSILRCDCIHYAVR
jgi:hypothetical protein